MKGKEDNFILYVIAGFILAVVAFLIYEDVSQKRADRMSNLKKKLNEGADVDTKNLKSDWDHITADVRTSFNRLEKEVNG
jgi:Flp pilus assembly protein TadB